MKYKDMKNNFKTMDSCEIYPSSIKIGSVEKYDYTWTVVPVMQYGFSMNSGIEYEERINGYQPIEEEKVLIELFPDSDIYIDLDQINNNRDLRKIRKSIRRKNIRIGKRLLDCADREIRVKKDSIHPYFINSFMDEPITIKQLKKLVKEKQR